MRCRLWNLEGMDGGERLVLRMVLTGNSVLRGTAHDLLLGGNTHGLLLKVLPMNAHGLLMEDAH